MKIILLMSLLAVTICGCGNRRSQSKAAENGSNGLVDSKKIYRQGDVIIFKNPFSHDYKSDSIILSGPGFHADVSHEPYSYTVTAQSPVGTVRYECNFYYKGEKTTKSGTFNVLPTQAPVTLEWELVNSYPHNVKSYTQGLFFDGDRLIESVGLRGESRLMQVDLTSGKILNSTRMNDDEFGEGAAMVNDRYYQITWEKGVAYRYDRQLNKNKSFTYSGEGWGLTSDGKLLYMSDGTSRIAVRDPETFEEIRSISVSDNDGPIGYVNELEWIDGEIWANVYLTSDILIINPETGAVRARINLEKLSTLIETTPDTDVLNGIAYQATTGKIYVTGKNWNKIFEIKLKPTK